jgi:16S rRNA processing protein RimM
MYYYAMNKEKIYLEIAKFTKPQGLKGHLRAQFFCDSPEVLRDFTEFYIGETKSPIEITVTETRKGFAVLKILGIDDAANAEVLLGETLYIDKNDYPLPENTWFVSDLIGLTVVNADTGQIYGKVAEILQSAPKDVYLIKTPGGAELMFPAIPEVLIDVDITSGIIKIRPLEGLFDEN